MDKAIHEYNTLVFDCDGVILDSNEIKTQAFYKAAAQFGNESACALVDYHKANGGVSRYTKFEFFVTRILGRDFDEALQIELLRLFAQEVQNGLLACRIAPGLAELKSKHPESKWMIVSGSDQVELRDVLSRRELDRYFDGGIFGSPDTKEVILTREQLRGNLSLPALFIGDSKYDYEAAKRAGLDFVFMSDWSDVEDPERWCGSQNVTCMGNLMGLLT